MSMVEKIEEEELRVTKHPYLRVLTGGKGPPEAPSEDWLSKLSLGQWFLCKRKDNKIDVILFMVKYKFTKNVLLYSNLNQEFKVIVDPVEFCKIHELSEVLSLEEQENRMIIGPIDISTWRTMLMLKEDNKNMATLNSNKYYLAIKRNKDCLRLFMDELYGRTQAA